MKISKRGEYALRALIDIGIAHELGRPLIQIGELADKEKLPIKFLEQILTQLKEGGYIESKRGKLGGYFLLMPARRIKIGQVIRLIDGPLAPVSCVSVIAYERCTCPDEEHCGLRMLMNDVRTAIANILDRFTLADTVEMTLKKISRNHAEIPFIESLLEKPISGEITVLKLPSLTDRGERTVQSQSAKKRVVKTEKSKVLPASPTSAKAKAVIESLKTAKKKSLQSTVEKPSIKNKRAVSVSKTVKSK